MFLQTGENLFQLFGEHVTLLCTHGVQAFHRRL